ncbi:MAG: hypothetical protein IAE66_03550 [Xanthomonadaceae bacterium]|nr:hypothetical protein [Xanthomonadaceae bacterium]
MRVMSAFIVIGLLLSSATVFAQQRDGTPIEQQMTAEEFKAAGLDKLSAEELARLNGWLNRTVIQESRKAAAVAVAEAKREEATQNKSMFGFGGGDAFEARMVGPFNGFERGKKYTLDNGQVWQQVDDARMYGVKLDNPTVQLKPSVIGNAWYMRVDDRAVNAKVKRIK